MTWEKKTSKKLAEVIKGLKDEDRGETKPVSVLDGWSLEGELYALNASSLIPHQTANFHQREDFFVLQHQTSNFHSLPFREPFLTYVSLVPYDENKCLFSLFNSFFDFFS